MTHIEERISKRNKRQKIQEIVLVSVLVTAGLGAAIVAPNSLQLLKYVQKYVGPKPRLDRRISQSVSRLIQKGLLEREQTSGHISLQLTKEGKKLAGSLLAKEQAMPIKPKKWDRKWRLIIFDVWERRRRARGQLRSMLKNIGFVKIQDSVWAYPYPCEELFAFLRADLQLGKGMLYVVAEEVENDAQLRRHFGLPLE